MFPFKEKLIEENKNFILVERTFEADVNQEDLIWHRDKEDRIIKVKEGKGWYIQIENELPKLMHANFIYTINNNTYHRIINKNRNKLIVEIKKILRITNE
tara:strand:- start:180 stop:479 length:300 start_codon:yes stop_codon:yes gene_type:complete